MDSPGTLPVEFLPADADQEEGLTYLATTTYSLNGAPTTVNIPDGGSGTTDSLVATVANARGRSSEFSMSAVVPVQLQNVPVE